MTDLTPIFRSFNTLVVSALLLISLPSPSQGQQTSYPNGGALARACLGESGDVSLISDALRKTGWEELPNGVGAPAEDEMHRELSPQVLKVLSGVSTRFLLGEGDLRNALFEARRELGHEESFIYTGPFGSPRAETFFKRDVGLFSISVSEQGEQFTQVECNFSGPWHPEDDTVRWILPGESFPGTLGHLKRVYGSENDVGPYAGGYVMMNPDGLEALFDADYPRLTFFNLWVVVPSDS
ncbi:MAG: hypothetical protein AAGL89_10915 [Pseudomonadota bacterium]